MDVRKCTIFLAIFCEDSRKNRPENRPKIYGIGTSKKSVPEMAIDGVRFSHSIEASPLSDKPIHPSIYIPSGKLT